MPDPPDRDFQFGRWPGLVIASESGRGRPAGGPPAGRVEAAVEVVISQNVLSLL